jgi:hypothetical protein
VKVTPEVTAILGKLVDLLTQFLEERGPQDIRLVDSTDMPFALHYKRDKQSALQIEANGIQFPAGSLFPHSGHRKSCRASVVWFGARIAMTLLNATRALRPFCTLDRCCSQAQ